MKVLLVEPGKVPRETELEAMQQAVGGLIEAVYPFEEPAASIQSAGLNSRQVSS